MTGPIDGAEPFAVPNLGTTPRDQRVHDWSARIESTGSESTAPNNAWLYTPKPPPKTPMRVTTIALSAWMAARIERNNGCGDGVLASQGAVTPPGITPTMGAILSIS